MANRSSSVLSQNCDKSKIFFEAIKQSNTVTISKMINKDHQKIWEFTEEEGSSRN